MITLDTLEREFLGHLRGGPPFPREWCAQGLVGSDTGLSIYANAYRSRLHETLESDHPMLALYLGDELWVQFCNGYINAHPSRHRSLRHFGNSGTAWLSSTPPFSDHPVIAELAIFERTLLDVFDAADAPRIDWPAMQALDAVAWPGLQLRFHPSVRLLPTSTNAVEIWRAMKDGQSPAGAAASVYPARLLWRDEERVSRFRPVNADEQIALAAGLVEAHDFASMCERLALHHPAGEVPALAIGFLRRWFDEGIISGLDVPGDQRRAT